MPLTKEELLAQRYKVIAPYPRMELDQHGVGDIISPYGMGFLYPEKVKEQYDMYPHLFQPLPWWSDRKPEDVEGLYLRLNDGLHCKLFKHFTSDGCERNPEPYFTDGTDELGWSYFITKPEIITEEEYTAYINQKQQ